MKNHLITRTPTQTNEIALTEKKEGIIVSEAPRETKKSSLQMMSRRHNVYRKRQKWRLRHKVCFGPCDYIRRFTFRNTYACQEK